MSRSYRKPYSAVCGVVSAKKDKVMAHRGVRRAQNYVTRLFEKDHEISLDILVPHFRECHWNDVYSWSRDGGKKFHHPDIERISWNYHMLAVQDLAPQCRWSWYRELYLSWPPKWYLELTRK